MIENITIDIQRILFIKFYATFLNYKKCIFISRLYFFIYTFVEEKFYTFLDNSCDIKNLTTWHVRGKT